MMDALVAHAKELIHDQKHFTARWLRDLKARTGAEPETAAMVGAAILGICLLHKEQAPILANGILIAVPIILTYVYPKERPALHLLLIYWATLAISTLFDEGFVQAFPFYYIAKLGLMAGMFLRPICGAQMIHEFLEKNKLINTADSAASEETATTEPPPFNAEELRELEKAKHKKSPPPEKPEGEAKSSRSLRTAQTQSDRTNSIVGVNKLKPEYNNNTLSQKQPTTPLITPPSSPALTTAKADSSRQNRQSLYLPAPGEKAPESPPPSRTPKASLYLPLPGENPMLNDPNYMLSSASNTSLSSGGSSTAIAAAESPAVSESSVEGDKNPDDLVFNPVKKIVFNAPFDYQALTYHMTVKNNCNKWIAYAIKSNAIPRVTAFPPSGILKPGDKQTVAVTVQKFNYDDLDVAKDRIAFDYLFCPADTKAFTHKLLQGTATRRRKNIKIEYNP